MTIRAQQSNIFGVSGPVFESPPPSVVSVLWAHLLRWIYVIYVDCSMIGEAALRTFAAKLCDQLKFSFPVACLLVNRITMRVPVGFLTTRRTEPRLGFLAASLAFAGIRPAVGQITSSAAELSGSILDAVRVHLRRFVTVLTDDLNRVVSHRRSISETQASKYLDNAQRISFA